MEWIDILTCYPIMKAVQEQIAMHMAKDRKILEQSDCEINFNLHRNWSSITTKYRCKMDRDKVPVELIDYCPTHIMWWNTGLRYQDATRHATLFAPSNVILAYGDPIEDELFPDTMAVPRNFITGAAPWYQTYFSYLNRTDGFPALIGINGYHARFNRYTKNPYSNGRNKAVNVENVFAVWMRDGVIYRPGGPAVILLKSYREFWDTKRVRNKYHCCDVRFRRDPHLVSDSRGNQGNQGNRAFRKVVDEEFEEFRGNIDGVDILSNTYFKDSVQGAQFAIQFA